MKRSGQIKIRANKTAKVNRRILPKRSLAILVLLILLIGITASFAWFHFYQNFQKPNAVASIETTTFKQPETLKELLALSPAQIEHCDIARMNLLCAEGLPGAENLDVGQCLTNLDHWAQDIKGQLDRNFHHYQENPDYFYNSTNFYKMMMTASILYSQYNIRYNPQRIETPAETSPNDHFFADSRDILIHGLLGSERMGTCSSMPVLYVALGRRLGYPVNLVATKGHLFLRWDSPAERFDMDGTQRGMNKYDDEHYKQWPFPLTDEEIKNNGYLQSMTPAQELSTFLSTRAACLHEAGRTQDAIVAHAAALRFEPNWQFNRLMLDYAKRFERAELNSPKEVSLPESISPNPIN